MHAPAPSIETENRNRTRTAFLAVVFAVTAVLLACPFAAPQQAHAGWYSMHADIRGKEEAAKSILKPPALDKVQTDNLQKWS